MKFLEIPQLPKANYRVAMDLESVMYHIERYIHHYNLDMDPEFQRGHVWAEDQQIKFIEYLLSGGDGGLEIYFNHPGWQADYKGRMVLVDGKQRLTAIKRFLDNEIKAFGHYQSEFEGKIPSSIQIWFNVAKLSEKDTLKWYISLNSGTPHTDEEIEKVRRMIEE